MSILARPSTLSTSDRQQVLPPSALVNCFGHAVVAGGISKPHVVPAGSEIVGWPKCTADEQHAGGRPPGFIESFFLNVEPIATLGRMETYAPFIGLAVLMVAMFSWLHCGLRNLDNSVREMSSRIDAQRKKIRKSTEAREQRLRDAIAAQGTDLREADEALGKEMREANEALGKEMREAIAAQGTEMREAIAAQGREMREANEALGREMREANEALGKEMREAIAAQGKEFRERTDGLAKEVAELRSGVSVLKARLDQPLFVKVVRDEFEDAA